MLMKNGICFKHVSRCIYTHLRILQIEILILIFTKIKSIEYTFDSEVIEKYLVEIVL